VGFFCGFLDKLIIFNSPKVTMLVGLKNKEGLIPIYLVSFAVTKYSIGFSHKFGLRQKINFGWF
jgi:hypothetical protein